MDTQADLIETSNDWKFWVERMRNKKIFGSVRIHGFDIVFDNDAMTYRASMIFMEKLSGQKQRGEP